MDHERDTRGAGHRRAVGGAAGLLALLALAPEAQEPRPPTPAQGEPARRIDQAELERLTEEIRLEIETLRGQKFPGPVKVSTADREGFLAYAKERMAATTTPERLRADERAAKVLGLIPREMDLMRVTLDVLQDQVGGFYDPNSDSFCLMETFVGPIARVILAHELTHALDDQLYDIDGAILAREGNSDALLAYHALVEGSGTSVMNRWMRAALLDKRLTMADLSNVPGMDSPALRTCPEYVWKPLVAAYMRGAAFLARSEKVLDGQAASPPTADVERAFREPPRSTEQVLHPEKYWDASLRDEPHAVELSTAELPAGWQRTHSDTLGEMGLFLLSSPLARRRGFDAKNPMGIFNVAYSAPRTEGWGGDRFALFEGPDAASIVCSASSWDTAADAAEFEASLAEIGNHLSSPAGGWGARWERPAEDQVLLVCWADAPPEVVDAVRAALRIEVQRTRETR